MAETEAKEVCHLATSATNPFPVCGVMPSLEDSFVVQQALLGSVAAEITCPDCRAVMATRMSSPEDAAAFLNAPYQR